MNRIALLLISFLLFSFPAVRANAAASVISDAKMKVIVLPIINSSQLSDDWVVQHIQDALTQRFTLKQYDYPNSAEVNSFLRDNGYVAGFGALPDKKTITGLTSRFAADGFLGLEIARVAYSTTNMSITVHTGKEEATVIINASIYDAKTDHYSSYSSQQTITNKRGPFTPYEKDETVTAGLDRCIQDILSKVDF